MILPAFHNTTKSNSRGPSEHHGKEILELRSPNLVEDYEDKSSTNRSRRVNMMPTSSIIAIRVGWLNHNNALRKFVGEPETKTQIT
jgi:hypothetical protein